MPGFGRLFGNILVTMVTTTVTLFIIRQVPPLQRAAGLTEPNGILQRRVN